MRGGRIVVAIAILALAVALLMITDMKKAVTKGTPA